MGLMDPRTKVCWSANPLNFAPGSKNHKDMATNFQGFWRLKIDGRLL